MQEDFKYAVQDLIDLICNETSHEKVPYSITRKMSFKAFEDARDELDGFLDDFRSRFLSELQYFKDEISDELSIKFSENYWIRFEDGHDVEEGQMMLCYIKKEDLYCTGLAVRVDESGISFKTQDGRILDPDYVGLLPRFKFPKQNMTEV